MAMYDGLANWNPTRDISDNDNFKYARWIYLRHSDDHETPVLTCDPHEYRVIDFVELFPNEDVISLHGSKKLLKGEGLILCMTSLGELKERLKSERDLKFEPPGALNLELVELREFEKMLKLKAKGYRTR